VLVAQVEMGVGVHFATSVRMPVRMNQVAALE